MTSVVRPRGACDQYAPLTARLSASVPAGGEDQLRRLGADVGGDRLPRLLDHPPSRAARPVQDEAFPTRPSSRLIASTASGTIGVVAA